MAMRKSKRPTVANESGRLFVSNSFFLSTVIVAVFISPSAWGQCAIVTNVMFTLQGESTNCPLSTCDLSCMSAYYYSQTSDCAATLTPTQYYPNGCNGECNSASGNTQMLSFNGGDISSVDLLWPGPPGESTVVVTPTGAGQCRLRYDPNSSPTSPTPPQNNKAKQNDGAYYGKILPAFAGTAVGGLIIGFLFTIPQSTTDKWHQATHMNVDPSVVFGVLVVIFMVATVSTTDTIRMSSDDDDVGSQVQIGVFRAGVAGGGESYSTTEDCGTFDECDSTCCKKLSLYCYLLKALSVTGLIVSAGAVFVSFLFPTARKAASNLAFFAATCYFCVIVILIDEVVGSAESSSMTCGLAQDGPVSTQLSAGFGLTVVSFVLSIAQGGTLRARGRRQGSVDDVATDGDDVALFQLSVQEQENGYQTGACAEPAVYEDEA
jgi:hypothetical protein